MTAEEKLLLEGLATLGIDGDPGVPSLVVYAGELDRWSEKLGLVHATGRDLVVRHLLDSLGGLKTVRDLTAQVASPEIADIGTGGGLPGIPLACFLPESTIHLVERSGRKCGFLRGTVLKSQIRNARVVHQDLNSVTGRFDIILFRAFQPLSAPLVTRLLGLLAPGGTICAYKGRDKRTRTEIESLGGELRAWLAIEVVPMEIPFLDEERSMVTIRNLRSDGPTIAGGS